jgi:hypothetical protein
MVASKCASCTLLPLKARYCDRLLVAAGEQEDFAPACVAFVGAVGQPAACGPSSSAVPGPVLFPHAWALRSPERTCVPYSQMQLAQLSRRRTRGASQEPMHLRPVPFGAAPAPPPSSPPSPRALPPGTAARVCRMRRCTGGRRSSIRLGDGPDLTRATERAARWNSESVMILSRSVSPPSARKPRSAA